MSSFGDPDCRAQTYSRKEKSLGLLCVNFLNHYTQEQVDSISLDEAACRLGVERRRIYDIVNVLESVGVLVRKAKNRYTWKGYEGIPKALEKLREAALNGEVLIGVKDLSDLSEIKMNNVRVCLASDDEEEEHSSNENSCPLENVKRQGKRPLNKSSPVSVLMETSKGSPKSKADCRREKSLGLLTQKFVQLFLVTQAQVVSLEDAARLLLGECKESAKLKTKVRRLYDIANILSSLNLIEKTHNTENRKPAFRWLGVKDNVKYTAEMVTKKRQFGTVLSTNTNIPSVPKAKRGRPSNKDGFESQNQPLNGAKSSPTLKPLQPRCTNVAGAVYNPVPVYPREGSAIPISGMATSTPGVPTSLTLGTSGGGWREWTTADSHRVSEHKGNDSAAAGVGFSTRLKPSGLTRPGFSSRNRDCPAGFSFGPFCPFRLQQQCLASFYPAQGLDRSNDRPDENQDREGSSQESEVTNPFPLHYQNEAMDQMFAHCMNAWKSWYLQAAVTATANATSVSSPVPSGHDPSDSVTEATETT